MGHHTDLAIENDLKEGDEASIKTHMGEIRQEVRLNKLIDPRVIYTDYGWWFPEKGTSDLYGWQEGNVNILTDDSSVEPIAGTTILRGASCNIKSDSSI